MIYHVKTQRSDGKKVVLGAEVSEELEYQDERLEKVSTLIDQHYEIEITSNGLDKLSTIRFRSGGTWSRNLNIHEIIEKLEM